MVQVAVAELQPAGIAMSWSMQSLALTLDVKTLIARNLCHFPTRI